MLRVCVSSRPVLQEILKGVFQAGGKKRTVYSDSESYKEIEINSKVNYTDKYKH